MGSALQQPRTQETVESLRVGPGRTVCGMDAAAELTGMYLQRVLPGPTRRPPPRTRKAPFYPANHHPTKNPAEAGFFA